NHLALHVSYPAAADVAAARARGVSPGGQIMVHGIRNGAGWIGRLHRLADWTDGCIAVTNREMDEIWRAVPVGTPIEIRP
ncbi:MAG TPA: L,D-transpeptidase family protein, partial [Longimicrobium sp.]|uniref:L,D-transpeptidase family protein n=1 Tax=Longimicrobium sp. TaxID=2029185 RepID=UPI002ED81DCF